MVHPIVEVEPELQLLALGDGKVLEQSHIPVEIGRSIDGRQNEIAVLTDLIWSREATRVDVLMRFQPARWIARQNRVELDFRRAQQRLIADRNAWTPSGVSARNDRAAAVRAEGTAVAHAEVLVLIAGQVGPALKLQSPGHLPAIDDSAGILVDVGLGQIHGVNSVEEVLAAPGQNPNALI